jgi:hypothetical protein
MKNLLTAILALFSIGLFSCQKEVDDIFAGNASPTGHLVKLVSKSGSDSSVLAFGYNSSNKLISLTSNAVVSGSNISFSERAERNSAQIIQRLIIKTDQYQQYGIDSAITNIQYTAGRYSAKVTNLNLGGIIITDSVSLVYDASGKVIREDDFLTFTGLTEQTAKTEYTYNGNNIATIKRYSYDSSTSSFTLDETYTYDQYDDKLSPMYFGVEAFVFESPELYSYNNPLKSSITSSGSTQNYTTSYTYNSANKPITATSSVQPGNTTATGTYYYQ